MNRSMKHFLCAALLALVSVAGVSHAAPPAADDPAASDPRAQAVRKRMAPILEERRRLAEAAARRFGLGS